MSVPTIAERAIRRRIARHGPITFAEYMVRALYGPGGYYTRSSVGDDYYTSPQVHPAFGALLAIQLFQFWRLLDRPDPFYAIEPASGDGLLGRDICRAARYLPDDFPGSLRYVAIDRHLAGRQDRSPTLAQITGDALRLPFRSATGCVISNELLDALPVHRVRVEGGAVRELYVDIQSDVADGYEGQLVEIAGDPSTPRLERRLSGLGVELSEGQTAEICLQLDDWSASVAAALDAGFVLTIDYGRSAHDLYDPVQRPNGTLVTYRSHRQTDTPLVDSGRQDITAQVDFTSLGLAGERAGLATVGNVSQGRFLNAARPADHTAQWSVSGRRNQWLDHYPPQSRGIVARCSGRTLLTSARRLSRLADGPDAPGSPWRVGRLPRAGASQGDSRRPRGVLDFVARRTAMRRTDALRPRWPP